MTHASASLVVVSPAKKVLMMKRPTTGAFANLTVFPGGALESTDPSLAYCALRETFEETGLLINPSNGQSSFMNRKLDFSATIAKVWGSFEPQLSPVSEWTTPAIIKQKRFTTQFYLCRINQEHSSSEFVSDEEVTAIEWISPSECLDRFSRGEILLYPPQFFILSYLAKYSVDDVLRRLKDTVIKPKPVEKFEGGVVMDWGSEGKAKLTMKDKLITKIDWKL